MRLIDVDALEDAMYHETFETDTDMQKWDSGCWIRYKMFENKIAEAPTIEERKEGFWDVYTDCEGKRTYYTCPFCKNKTNHFMYEPKYCDNCGARLKKEGAEE